MRFEELLERWERGSLSHAEAASALGVSERTLRRWRQRYEEEGADGLVDRRVGQPSPRRAPEDELERMRALYQQDYQGFTIKHFHEKLEQRHGYKLGYTTTRLYLQKTGTVQPAPGAAPIAASGRAGRCAACCCIRTARSTPGSPASRRST